ncbi:hypothetical protein RUMCAL_03400 [Ruminococcus callidus ATCC 27760]|uniref:Uncharacterized protein n=1 Tax=Ruminococcus callidus ATCC 27760 TaxID=411473 RepID=U2LJ65_9FIRM|nr:hypothetical protein RUMCAL_03400 [Ruminococcus callidus ATCC 27760]
MTESQRLHKIHCLMFLTGIKPAVCCSGYNCSIQMSLQKHQRQYRTKNKKVQIQDLYLFWCR